MGAADAVRLIFTAPIWGRLFLSIWEQKKVWGTPMCGRLALTLPNDAMVNLFKAAPDNDLPEGPNYNVCPTNKIHVVVAGRRLTSMRWGFIPHWYKAPNDGPLLINARAETIANKPAFRDACRARRCLIPANGFYEWTKTPHGDRLPWYIHGAAPLVFAGIWQTWGDGLATCAIVTCKANEKMAELHARMPVLLSPQDWGTWLGETENKAAPLMTAASEDLLQFHRVDTAVNSNRSAGPNLIDPIKN